MKQSLSTKFCIFFLGFSISGLAQTDMSKAGFSFKLYTGPEFFFQTNMSGAPMPTICAKLGFIINTTELEFGFKYYPKFLIPKTGNDSTTYRSINYTQHYILPSVHLHQKIFAQKNHVLSASFGVGILLAEGFKTDSVMNDGSHHLAGYPGYVEIGYAFTLEPSIRYSYVIKKNMAFSAGLFFCAKTGSEFYQSEHPAGWPGTSSYLPPTNLYSFGINLGFHFMVPFSNDPPRFFMDTVKREKKIK